MFFSWENLFATVLYNITTYFSLVEFVSNNYSATCIKWTPTGTYNLGQNEWNISTTPPPHFNDAKMAGFGLRAPSSLLWGGRGIIVLFYSVQDCPRFTLA